MTGASRKSVYPNPSHRLHQGPSPRHGQWPCPCRAPSPASCPGSGTSPSSGAPCSASCRVGARSSGSGRSSPSWSSGGPAPRARSPKAGSTPRRRRRSPATCCAGSPAGEGPPAHPWIATARAWSTCCSRTRGSSPGPPVGGAAPPAPGCSAPSSPCRRGGASGYGWCCAANLISCPCRSCNKGICYLCHMLWCDQNMLCYLSMGISNGLWTVIIVDLILTQGSPIHRPIQTLGVLWSMNQRI